MQRSWHRELAGKAAPREMPHHPLSLHTDKSWRKHNRTEQKIWKASFSWIFLNWEAHLIPEAACRFFPPPINVYFHQNKMLTYFKILNSAKRLKSQRVVSWVTLPSTMQCSYTNWNDVYIIKSVSSAIPDHIAILCVYFYSLVLDLPSKGRQDNSALLSHDSPSNICRYQQGSPLSFFRLNISPSSTLPPWSLRSFPKHLSS